MTTSNADMQAKDESTEPQQVIADSHGTDQYLTFVMDDEEYGVDILSVQEIRGWEKTTKIPNSPSYLRGVINLRGTIVPIVDLRSKFNLEAVEYTPVTVVIVLKVLLKAGERTIGIVVDAVSDVYSIDPENISSPPDVSESQNNMFIKGLAKIDEIMVIVLDLSNLLEDHELPDQSEN